MVTTEAGDEYRGLHYDLLSLLLWIFEIFHNKRWRGKKRPTEDVQCLAISKREKQDFNLGLQTLPPQAEPAWKSHEGR